MSAAQSVSTSGLPLEPGDPAAARYRLRARGPLAALCLVAAFWALRVYLAVLGFDLLRSDVADYWNDSLNWRAPYNPFHVPAYPLLIALVRGATFNWLDPITIMTVITFASHLIGALLVSRSLAAEGLPASHATLGLLLFSFWPLTGLLYGVYPLADGVAMALLLGGIHALQHRRSLAAGALLGLAMIAHKAMWPFVGLLLVALAWRGRQPIPARLLIPASAPLAIVYLLGAHHHGSPTWIVASNVRAELATRSGLPLLDGVLGSILGGRAPDVVQAVLVAGVALCATALLAATWRRRDLMGAVGTAFAASVLVLAVVLNQVEIWAVMRFGKLLVLPLLVILYTARPTLLDAGRFWTALLGLGLLSNFAYAWYMARVYFAA